MNRTTRIVCALLAGLLLSTTLLACGNTKGDEQTTTTAPTTDSNEITTSATAETTIDPMIANDPKLTADNWGGEEFVILYNGSQVEPNKDFTAETLNGNVLNDAIYNRNMAIQDKYNLKINASYYSDGNISTMVGNSNKAGDNAYHLVEANGAYSMSMALNGQLYNLEALEYVNLDKPYWNSMILEGSSIEGKNYFAYSDANIHAYGATPCVLFNKEMLATFQLGDIYQIVTDGKWTFDVMSTMIQTVTGDINGDGVITKDDRLGYIANNFCVDCFISGTGYRMITKDADDLPVLNVETEKFYNIIDGIKKLCAEENGVFLIDRTSTATEAREYWTEEAFVADRALFVGGNLKWAERLRAMENDFGIVPLPKYDENQENYYTTSRDYYTLMTVLDHAESTKKTQGEAVSAYLQFLMKRSAEIVVPLYKTQRVMKNCYYHDYDQAGEMYDLIVGSLTYDFRTVYSPQLNNITWLWRDNMNSPDRFMEKYLDKKDTFAAAVNDTDYWLGIIEAKG